MQLMTSRIIAIVLYLIGATLYFTHNYHRFSYIIRKIYNKYRKDDETARLRFARRSFIYALMLKSVVWPYHTIKELLKSLLITIMILFS
ncbi:MAG: hypothetical protein K6C08_06260 [Oscillospiraceae bacterium]|nr:hypothetical protein [Oscillospiraceae bacterium]